MAGRSGSRCVRHETPRTVQGPPHHAIIGPEVILDSPPPRPAVFAARRALSVRVVHFLFKEAT